MSHYFINLACIPCQSGELRIRIQVVSDRPESQETSGIYRASKTMRLAVLGHLRAGMVRRQVWAFPLLSRGFTFCSVWFAWRMERNGRVCARISSWGCHGDPGSYPAMSYPLLSSCIYRDPASSQTDTAQLSPWPTESHWIGSSVGSQHF